MAETLQPHDQGAVIDARPSLIQELGTFDEYTYVTPDETSKILSDFGYGEGWKWVDSYYFRPATEDRPAMGVGVFHVTPAVGKDHFGVVPGVIMTESVAQSALILARLEGVVVGDARPLLTRDSNEYDMMTVSEEGDVDLNVLVQRVPDTENFQVRGEVVLGTETLVRTNVEGVVKNTRTIEVGKKRRRQIQARTAPLFPLQP